MPTERLPYGDAFITATPALDRLSQQLYGEHIRKERYKEQQDKMLDDEFARNMSGIRDADIGDLTKAYGDYKLSYQAGMKKQNITPAEQLEILKKKASVYDVINKSKQGKLWEDLQQKQIMNDKKGIYADDAHQQLISRRNTPISKLDTTKDENLLYKYSVPDLDKELKTARGAKRAIPITIGVSKTDPLKDDKEVYDAQNTPKQYYGSLLNDVVSKNQSRNFAGLVNNKYSDEELDDLVNKYQAKINDPKFIAIYGKPEPFTDGTRGMTDLEKAVATQTMEEYVNLDVKPSKLISELNQDRAKTRSEEFRREMAEKAHKNALSRLYVYAGIQQGKEDKNELLAIRELKSYHTQAANNGGEFTPRQEIINNLSTGTGILKQSPNKFIMSDDGTTVTYSGNGIEPRTVPVEAFFNDITNALPTKDKGNATQKAIDDVKKKDKTVKPKGKYD